MPLAKYSLCLSNIISRAKFSSFVSFTCSVCDKLGANAIISSLVSSLVSLIFTLASSIPCFSHSPFSMPPDSILSIISSLGSSGIKFSFAFGSFFGLPLGLPVGT
ncbi:hypothetical protein AWRI1631_111370 [Saccharomyces cerevisiae AWRI1631]|uniref:Uncharacterized protein n=1 Tax=Saccharomyces cerevisiae (strain AWRI1631) TaxID=545124 RepID=B5VM70_YEAS6|nr:hypothetical protein AWRI1631_111370 [Saccharomyces cerevisiae AWRI1631]